MVIDDYDAVADLWRGTAGVELAEGDERAEIASYLERNPGLSRVLEIDGQLVAAVLCGHDGRRALIYHLAVDARHRGRGIGRLLVEECIAGLKREGLRRVFILVASDNPRGRDFWTAQGFEVIDGACTMGRTFA
jgi:N-acetylglutamate synthase